MQDLVEVGFLFSSPSSCFILCTFVDWIHNSLSVEVSLVALLPWSGDDMLIWTCCVSDIFPPLLLFSVLDQTLLNVSKSLNCFLLVLFFPSFFILDGEIRGTSLPSGIEVTFENIPSGQNF